MTVTAQDLEQAGLAHVEAGLLARHLASLWDLEPVARWTRIRLELLTPKQPFAVHERIYSAVTADWDSDAQGPFPAWTPLDLEAAETNLGRLMAEQGCASYGELHAWSVRDRGAFWDSMAKATGLVLAEPGEGRSLDPASGAETPRWFPGARLNIAESCKREGGRPAVVSRAPGGAQVTVTHAELWDLSGRVANGLVGAGFQAGDAIGCCGPMDVLSVAVYLGIVRAGSVVVSIADSFSPSEIETRLRISKAKGIFTQDVLRRAGKELPLYAKVRDANAPMAIVQASGAGCAESLRDGDLSWEAFLSDDVEFATVIRDPEDHTNVLFSSGTTGEPKAIPWSHTTPLKCAADGYLHHDIRPGDVVAWPTNLGWMMGPWLIYASLMNDATIALYEGAPTGREFCAFVQDAGVTMLGVVPSLVAAWRATSCADAVDWTCVRAFSSTGECSNAGDMLWLMSRAGYRPVIEYCGGTEIGGGYITGTLVQPASPATFTTPAMGLEFVILDEEGEPAEAGEVFLVPPSVGLSAELLNRDHHAVYYADTPTPAGCAELLRRHGDAIERLPGGFYRAHGRVDDTMNLGGIKVSSAAIEGVVSDLPGIQRTAAVAVAATGGGPSRLVIFVEGTPGAILDADTLKPALAQRIKQRLNPLFKLSEVRLIDRLPRTASNKVMRRKLRDLCLSHS